MKKTFLSTLIYISLFACSLTPAVSANQQNFISEELQQSLAQQQQKISEVESKNQELLNIVEKQNDAYRKDSEEKLKQISELKVELGEAKDNLNNTNQSIAALKKETEQSNKNLSQEINNLSKDTSSKISDLDNRVFNQTWVGLLIIFGLLGLLGYIYRSLKNQLDNEDEGLVSRVQSALDSVKKAEENIVQSDTQLVNQLNEVLTQIKQEQDNLTQMTTAVASNSVMTDEEKDHSLAIKLADEIHRMRRRINALPEGIKGLKSLSKSLERLEGELESKGYEIIDYLGVSYTEGMALKAKFIPSDELDDNQSIITRVVYPQVNYNGMLIQEADVEVSVG